MNFTDEHRDWASTIATFFAKKDSNDATQMSNLFVMLWNAVGSQNAVSLVWHYITQIRVGINSTYPGVNMFNKGSIHPMKQKFVNTLYKRLVRELVMPIIHQFFKDEVQPGAFVSTLVIPEDMPRLQGVVEYDQSAAVEVNLRQLINNVKFRPGTANLVTDALRRGTFDNLEIDEDEDVDSDGGFDSNDLPDFVPIPQVRQLPRPNFHQPIDLEDIDAEQAQINQNYLEDLQDVELQLEENSPKPVKRSSGPPGAPIKPRRAREQSPPPHPRKRVYRQLDLSDSDE